MSALPTHFPSFDSAIGADIGVAREAAMAIKWDALHDAAGTVAALAGVAMPDANDASGRFLAAVTHAGEARQRAAERGVADLFAVMQPGIAALLAITARGGNPQIAAQALWDEFALARTALLALAEPHGHA
jgi:hypothetical protein